MVGYRIGLVKVVEGLVWFIEEGRMQEAVQEFYRGWSRERHSWD